LRHHLLVRPAAGRGPRLRATPDPGGGPHRAAPLPGHLPRLDHDQGGVRIETHAGRPPGRPTPRPGPQARLAWPAPQAPKAKLRWKYHEAVPQQGRAALSATGGRPFEDMQGRSQVEDEAWAAGARD